MHTIVPNSKVWWAERSGLLTVHEALLFHGWPGKVLCKVKKLVPEMQYLFQDLGLDESQIM